MKKEKEMKKEKCTQRERERERKENRKRGKIDGGREEKLMVTLRSGNRNVI